MVLFIFPLLIIVITCRIFASLMAKVTIDKRDFKDIAQIKRNYFAITVTFCFIFFMLGGLFSLRSMGSMDAVTGEYVPGDLITAIRIASNMDEVEEKIMRWCGILLSSGAFVYTYFYYASLKSRFREKEDEDESIIIPCLKELFTWIVFAFLFYAMMV